MDSAYYQQFLSVLKQVRKITVIIIKLNYNYEKYILIINKKKKKNNYIKKKKK